MNWTTSSLWWPPMYRSSRPMCGIAQREGPPAASCGSGTALEAPRQVGSEMWKVARQFVEVDKGRAAKARSRRRWSSSRLRRPSAKCSCSWVAKRSRSASEARAPLGQAAGEPAPVPDPGS